jgi:hypothetical protein
MIPGLFAHEIGLVITEGAFFNVAMPVAFYWYGFWPFAPNQVGAINSNLCAAAPEKSGTVTISKAGVDIE